MLWALTLGSIAILWWVYDGYGRFLAIIVAVRSVFTQTATTASSVAVADSQPSVTVLLTVHNEASVIQRRIENILSCDYPSRQLEIVVASDGSTDQTNQIVQGFPDRRVRLFESPGLGKTATQNAACATITSDLIVFTDADIEFDRQFLQAIARPFTDASVGAVDGRLMYRNAALDDVQAGQGYYWNYELKLRRLESQLGILAVVAGACFAVRRSLLREMDPSIGEDCIVPLDIAVQNHRVLHEPAAIAFDQFDPDTGVTLRRRVRMTLRNWQGTWTRSRLLNPLRSPGYAFALWSHKLLRWLSPVFLATATVCSLLLLVRSPSLLTGAAFLPFALLFVLASCGWLTTRRGLRIPAAGTAYGFLLANTAFLIGITRAIAGQRVHSYRNR